MKKTIRNTVLIVLAMAIVASVSIFGTLAWLSDEDGAVNVMTLGNVYIDQNEYEWDNDELVDFTQGKPLLPYVGQLGWTNTDYMDGAYRSFTMNNVVDKYVTVTNTGSTPAYVRTILALEMGEYDTVDEFYYKVVGVATNAANGAEFKFEGAWNWSDKFVAEIDGNNYLILVATHEDPVMPGEETIPSLLQVYMNKEADNEEVIKVDGNGNGMYDILAFSQAVQSTGFASAEEALNEAFGEISANDLSTLPWNASDYDLPVIVNTPAEFTEALTAAGKAKSGNTEIILAADLDLSDVDWTPIKVDGYNGAGVVTLDGGNNTITGLNAPLFEGGFAGKSGIVIKHLTIADSDIKSNSTLGAGAFIANADSMHVLTLEDCHLVDSTIDSPDSRNGGLIGWFTGYANLNDGPVKTYVTIENCSVIDCEINGTSVGAIAGHPGASDYTYTTIKNCLVLRNTLTSTDDGEWRVGAIVGTANNGHVEIIDCTIGGNVMTQPNGGATTANTYPGDEVGRFVPGITGTLVVNGTVAGAATADELNDLLKDDGEATLVCDIVAETAIEIPAGAVLDGNGYSITYGIADDYHLVKLNTGATVKNLTLNNYRVRTENATNGVVTLENVTINMDNDLTGLDISRGAGTAKLTNVVCKGTKDAAHLDPNTQVQVDYTPYGDVLLGTKWALEANGCDFGSLHGWNTTNGSSVSLNNTTYTVFRMHYWNNRTLYINGVETAWADSGAIPVAHDVGGCWSVQPAFK